MSRKLPRLEDFLKGWKVWGLGAILDLFAPWFARIVELRLISDFYQPGLNAFASMLGGAGVVMSYALLLRSTLTTKRRILIASIVTFLIAFVICLVFWNTVGIIWAPQTFARAFVHVIWLVTYVTLFVSLGVAFMAAWLLFPRSTQP